jgi:hypothetical protein
MVIKNNKFINMKRLSFRIKVVILLLNGIFSLLTCFAFLPEGTVSFTGREGEKVFVIHAPMTDLDEFRELARQAVRLKPYGRVEINISSLADKGFHEIPPGNNFWYEYASYNPTPFKFFPDKRIAPFIPEEFVRKNRTLLLAKAEILREFGLGAAFWCYEPNFLPESFFEAYPHMRGPRIDHPRRGNHPAFAPCIDTRETQEMFAGMVAELLRNVPEIRTFFFKTNDAGSGICWSDWLYTGTNGPVHCKDISTGERVATLMNSFKAGAEQAGQDISIHLTSSMFTRDEEEEIILHLPDNCFFQSPSVRSLSSGIGSNYPVLGILQPTRIISGSSALNDPNVHTIFVSLRASYDRGHELLSVADKIVEMIIRFMDFPVAQGKEKEELYRLCVDWAGEGGARDLFDAFIAIEEAERYKSSVAPRVRSMYWGLSARHINRPLVFAPHLLTAEQEAYFLPHVFNASETEARLDYTDIHGGAGRTVEPGAISRYVAMLNDAISLMERIPASAPEYEFIMDMTRSWRIYSSIMRSSGNFGEAQAIRDRHAERLTQPRQRPDKNATWDGDPDLQAFNAIMRDELDNALELIDMLNDGGMRLIRHADDHSYEDTFLLGPDIIGQLKMKRKIMLEHWTDIEGFLTTPYK